MPYRPARTPPVSLSRVTLALTLSASACADLTISDRPRGSACEPGTAEACYSGDTATKDVGVCRAGFHVCNADGTAFGACEGEVTPKAEDCATEADEDCNGKTGEDQAAGCACAPGTAKACYGGPEGTKDIGVCREGIAFCEASGKAYGPCEEEVVPSAERCSLPAEDETCDAEPRCTGEPVRAERFGSAEGQVARGLAASPDGAVLLTGAFLGSLKLGDVQLLSQGSTDAFVTSLDAANNAIWSRRFGDEFAQTGVAIARDADGNAVVMGEVTNKINFGTDKTTELAALQGKGIYIAKLDAKDGHHLWSRAFSGNNDQNTGGVAVDAQGSTLFCGYFVGDIQVLSADPKDKLTTAGVEDMVFGKLDKNGVPLWSTRLGDAATQQCRAIAVDAEGNALVTGTAAGTFNADAIPLASAAGAPDVFVAKIKPDGSYAWAKLFGGNGGSQFGLGIATNAAGDVIVAGQFDGVLDFGGGSLPLDATGKGIDTFVAKLDKDGNHVWSKSFTGPGGTGGANAVTVDAAGNVILTGVSAMTVDYGGGPLTSAGMNDIFVVKLDEEGGHVWSAIYGTPMNDLPRAIAADLLGGVIVAGHFIAALNTPLKIGGDSLQNAGADDVFLARFKP